MKRIIVLSSCGILLIILVVISLYRWVPDSMVIKTEAELNRIGIIMYQRPAIRGEKINLADLYIEEYCTAKILGLFPLKTVKVYIFEDTEVILGGMLFGVQFGAGNVYIADLFETWDKSQVRNPGKEAGLKLLDVVKEIDGVAVTTTTEAEMALHRANGQDIMIKVSRDGIEIEAMITPDKSRENFYFYGIQFQDYVIGIGTLSYINEKNNSFGGFGHGVKASDVDTLLPVENSIVLSAQYRSFTERTESSIGEIMVNYLGEVGNVALNSSTGVYGYLHSMPNTRNYDGFSLLNLL